MEVSGDKKTVCGLVAMLWTLLPTGLILVWLDLQRPRKDSGNCHNCLKSIIAKIEKPDHPDEIQNFAGKKIPKHFVAGRRQSGSAENIGHACKLAFVSCVQTGLNTSRRWKHGIAGPGAPQ